MKGNFGKLINGDLPVLVDFHAIWCGPCKMQDPVIKDLAKEVKGQLRVIKIDIDKNQNIAQRYQVRGVPTLAIFKNGEIVWRESGVQTKHGLLKIIDQIL